MRPLRSPQELLRALVYALLLVLGVARHHVAQRHAALPLHPLLPRQRRHDLHDRVDAACLHGRHGSVGVAQREADDEAQGLLAAAWHQVLTDCLQRRDASTLDDQVL